MALSTRRQWRAMPLQVLRREVEDRAREAAETASARITAERSLAASQARLQALETTVAAGERDFGSIKAQLEHQLEARMQASWLQPTSHSV